MHGSGISHATAASPKPSFKAPWRVGDAVVGRGNAGRTKSRSGHPCPCQNCLQGPPAERTGRGSLLNRPSCPPPLPPPPDDPNGQGTELKNQVKLVRQSGSKEGGRVGMIRSYLYQPAHAERRCTHLLVAHNVSTKTANFFFFGSLSA